MYFYNLEQAKYFVEIGLDENNAKEVIKSGQWTAKDEAKAIWDAIENLEEIDFSLQQLTDAVETIFNRKIKEWDTEAPNQ